ncbi:PpiC-type peptidyl-prolyl cis-trans isomerase [Roseibium sp. TrichSKD4]|uniref:peptidylprolyl isomerase n=1 Tax=Roseibium sp. TrichSKD4 TaxID=744980 RepID=UPI0001E5613A|nr:peptidylprolyl isomerase [Roseibium sp. TrichSKD4]EFO33700.1 PpiC-type peptidyl-prolyl cis-trans isomerase [Roseibium sp. TrichSKD4]
MLDALRKGAGTWVAKIFIALLVFSFAVWGVADVFSGFGQNTVAKVGETEIATVAFDRAYRQDLNRFGRQLGRPLSTTEGAQFGIPQQTLGRMIAEAALNETGRELNLGISDDHLAGIIQNDPNFRRAGGGYDRALLAQVLRNIGMSEDEYVIQQREFAERQQIAQAVSGDMPAPTAYLEVLNAYENETRDISLIVLTAEQVGEIEDPDQAALEAYFEENKVAFRAPEYRKVTLLELTPEALARPEDISDDMALDEYERDKSRYFEAEKRRARQIVFQDPAEAAEASQRLSDGTTFEELMAERNLSDNDVNLGLMAQEDFLDTAVGEAAFSLSVGGTSEPVDGRFSTAIVNVLEIQPEATQPFDDVKADIKALLAAEQAEREVLDLLDEIEDARAGGDLLAEVAERLQLTTTMPDAFDHAGKGLDENSVSLPDAVELISGVFSSDVGVENDPVQLGNRGFLWYEVSEVIPARERTLDEVTQKVIDAWKEAELAKRLENMADDYAERVKNGETMQALAETAGLTVQTNDGVKRTATSLAVSRNGLTQLFAGPEGLVAAVEAADSAARVVAKVNKVNIPAFFAEEQGIQALGMQLANQMQDSLLSQYVSGIEERAGVEINDGAVALVLGLSNQSGQTQ